jgi:hypothetical protein
MFPMKKAYPIILAEKTNLNTNFQKPLTINSFRL